MYVILPLCDIPSPAKTERILELLSKVGAFTRENEPQCHAYAWLRNAQDSDAVPHHWLRGIELYETPEANQQTHRAGEDYKQFRAAVASEGLFTEYPDLRFWKPTGVGFMTRSPVNFAGDRKGEKQYFVVQELSPAKGGKLKLLEGLGEVAGQAQSSDKVNSFWVLDRADPGDGEDVVVVSRFDSKEDYDAFAQSEREAWKTVSGQVKVEIVTTWVEAGIGFLNR